MQEVRLIDANAFAAQYGDYYAEEGPEEGFIGTVGDLIAKQPTIEAELVRHGRWIDKGEYAVCTECGGRSGTQYDGVEPIALMTRFCQHCGAKMKEDKDAGSD